jgi:short-subunit dehydrogenase involved in D-alanine esterification of teichoic acids
MRSSLLKQAATTDVDDRHDLRAFAKWFKQRQPPFTVVIDGANVAYNSQNFVGGRFSFEQVELAVAALQAEGETPLVILPTRYVDSKSVPNHSSGRAFPGGGILHLRRQVSSAEGAV